MSARIISTNHIAVTFFSHPNLEGKHKLPGKNLAHNGQQGGSLSHCHRLHTIQTLYAQECAFVGFHPAYVSGWLLELLNVPFAKLAWPQSKLTKLMTHKYPLP